MGSNGTGYLALLKMLSFSKICPMRSPPLEWESTVVFLFFLRSLKLIPKFCVLEFDYGCLVSRHRGNMLFYVCWPSQIQVVGEGSRGSTCWWFYQGTNMTSWHEVYFVHGKNGDFTSRHKRISWPNNFLALLGDSLKANLGHTDSRNNHTPSLTIKWM